MFFRLFGVLPAVNTCLSYLAIVFTVSAALHPVALAIERYVAVSYPFFHSAHVTNVVVRVTDVCIWLAAAIICQNHLMLFLNIFFGIDVGMSKEQLQLGTQV